MFIFDPEAIGDAAKARRTRWLHAARVLGTPEFVTLHWLTNASGRLDVLIGACERDVGLFTETMALADHWNLGFFEILRIASSPEYKKYADAEFTIGKELEALKTRANMVRSAFAKLQRPGKSGRIMPSHSSVTGERGVIYAVYDNHGGEIDISRRELADEFLELLSKLPPSRRLAELMAIRKIPGGAQIVPL